jgi:hypothetical protein
MSFASFRPVLHEYVRAKLQIAKRRHDIISKTMKPILFLCVVALVPPNALCQSPQVNTVTRASVALRLADDLKIPHSADEKQLYGLFPIVFPGGYNGVTDLTYYDKVATFETVVVAIVRWAGWDTVHYDQAVADQVKPFVTPEGFPYYQPDPTPRSIPYIVAALSRGLITKADLPHLREPIAIPDVDRLAATAQRICREHPIKTSAPSSLRIFNALSPMADGKQGYFPLGPLDTQLDVGMGVAESSYSHQSEAIRGDISNWSPTVNAVGVWASARSMQKNARVWGQFISAGNAEGPEQDAQVIGLEVDVINGSLPGKSPNRSKTGIQIVGVGSQPGTNAIEIIGAGPAKWTNGILFQGGSMEGSGSVIGLAGDNTLDYGIDFSGTKFKGSAFLLHQGSSVDLGNISGNRSRLYTDAIGNGHMVLQAGADGLRVTSNDDSKSLLIVDRSGEIETAQGKIGVRVPVPVKSTDPCEKAMWAADDKYFYVCAGKNIWKRTPLESW